LPFSLSDSTFIREEEEKKEREGAGRREDGKKEGRVKKKKKKEKDSTSTRSYSIHFALSNGPLEGEGGDKRGGTEEKKGEKICLLHALSSAREGGGEGIPVPEKKRTLRSSPVSRRQKKERPGSHSKGGKGEERKDPLGDFTLVLRLRTKREKR